MSESIDLAGLARMSAPMRAFLSVYLSRPQAVDQLDNRFAKMRRLLKGGGAEKDEREHFDENVRTVQAYLKQHPLTSGSLCMFSCWAMDFFQVHELAAPVEDVVWIDSSPYIRPLAQWQEEYEDVAVVVADNKKAKIYLVSSAVAGEETVISGNVKNHVKKGGWSQQRYERRRDKELLHYAREIVAALHELDRAGTFRRILLVGGKEILRVISENLPAALREKVADKTVHLGKGDGKVHQDIVDLFFEQERQSEQNLWDRIRTEALRGGLGAVGLEEVFGAALDGRIDTLMVNRDYCPQGVRCRSCDHLHAVAADKCQACGSDSLFTVDIINEIVELVTKTGGEVEFADPIVELSEAGEVAALLRYRP